MRNTFIHCLTIILLTFGTTILAEDSKNFKGCSDTEVQLIKDNVIEAQIGAQRILNQMIERSVEVENYPRSIKSQVKTAKNILECAIEELKSPQYSCNEFKDDAVYNAGRTLPFRGSLVKLASLREWGRVSLGQTILHEATHHCKTTDAAYFGDTHKKNDPPRKVGMISWSRIADTYPYWMKYGFCIPSIDC